MGNGNAEIADYETMIAGLRKYKADVQQSCSDLMTAMKDYHEGVNDQISATYANKIGELCKKIDPDIMDKVDRLVSALSEELENVKKLEEIRRQEMN